MTDSHSPSTTLTRADRNANAWRALTKLIPVVGEGIGQLAFGPLDELRAKRVDDTLQEIVERLERQERRSLGSEEYANLLEHSIPRIARSTTEDVRHRFRDLLSNAATLPTADPQWAQAELAEQLLSELGGPAVAVMGRLAGRGPEPSEIVSLPEPQVVDEGFNWMAPTLGQLHIPYAWPVVEEWTHRLREKRLLGYNSSSARGGFGGVRLTDLGEMLVRWIIAPSA